jgi:hypothetical protein
MTAQSRGHRTAGTSTASVRRGSAPTDSSLAALQASLHERMDDHIDQVVRRVAGTIPSLGRHSTVSLHELWSAANCVLRSSLRMLIDGGEPSQRDVETWQTISTRSAHLGVPLEDVLQGLRICATTLWEALSATAVRLGDSHPFDVLDQAPRLWMNYDVMASAVTQAHQAVGSALQVEHSQRVCAFLAALRRHPTDLETAEVLSRALGLEPNGWFVAVVHANVGAKVDAAQHRVVIAEEPDRTVMLLQLPSTPPEGEEQAAWLLDDLGCTPAGIGIQRAGLAGAHQALVDAEAAYHAAVALRVPIVKFRARWLSCLALKHRDHYELLVEPAVGSLRHDEQMRDTVAAYLQAEGSLPGAAALLGLHANTVAYRLRQLAERTGLDARSAPGTALAQMALTFAQIEPNQWQEASLGQAAS